MLFILNYLIIITHLFFIFSPILLFFVKIPTNILKYLLLFPIFVVSHWRLLKNQCSLTLLQKYFGFLETNKGDNSGFSSTYLRWFYEPIMQIFNMEWNNNNLDIVIDIHWMINFLIIWYFTFF